MPIPAANFHIFTRLFTELDTALSDYVGSTASSVIAAFTPVATTLLLIYVMFWGWAMMRGLVQELVMDGTTRLVRLSVIFALATSVGYYNEFLAGWLWAAPDALATVITGSSTASGSATSGGFLDALMNSIFDEGSKYVSLGVDTGLLSGGLIWMVVGVLVWCAGVLVASFAAYLLALSKMALAIALGVGPLFILGLIFEPTKRFFDAWLGQVLNYVFLVMLTAAASKLILTILQKYLVAVAAHQLGFDAAIPIIVFSIIGFLVLAQMPHMASSLGGGVAVGTFGVAEWIGRKVRGGASGAVRGTAKAGTAVAKRTTQGLRSGHGTIKANAVNRMSRA